MPVFRLTDDYIFPRTSLAEASGLLAVGGDLCPGRLINAYSLGIFPWFSEGDPILWWFTSPRLVIYPESFRISKRLARYMRKPLYRVSFDLAFKEVITACANIRQQQGEGTWITDEMREAYIELHRLGYAHSVECWHDDTLAGGLYGVALDRVFFGESMFTVRDNSSKIALASLAALLRNRGFRLMDCQMTTEHLLQFGACEIPGSDFSKDLRKYIQKLSPDGKWNYESSK